MSDPTALYRCVASGPSWGWALSRRRGLAARIRGAGPAGAAGGDRRPARSAEAEAPLAIVGLNDATGTTDDLLLKRADAVSLATGPGPLRLFPALTVQPDMTIAAFDAAHSRGADHVIVPAMNRR
ncbi:hypothetical protein [Paenirhodobacter sp.]|uniref:hypothetical protein n=1 Tax=Paenirhodobacter sp. TaxID=1965326 RepID=UPI003B3CBD97